MGKGSRPRPFTVSQQEFNQSFTNIFGEKPPKERWVPPPLPVLDDKADTKESDKESK